MFANSVNLRRIRQRREKDVRAALCAQPSGVRRGDGDAGQASKAAVIHPTGTGKSFVAFKWIEEHADARFVWLSPSEYIYHTQIENVTRTALDFPVESITFLTYARLMMMTDEEIAALAPFGIILDEFHRCGAKCWGGGVARLLAAYPGAQLLGLSATKIRYLDGQRDMAEELFSGCVASEMTLGEAVVRGILPAPTYVTTIYQVQRELKGLQKRIDAGGTCRAAQRQSAAHGCAETGCGECGGAARRFCAPHDGQDGQVSRLLFRSGTHEACAQPRERVVRGNRP